MVCVAPPSGASVCAHFSLAPTRTTPARPHSPLPQELDRDLTSCPQPAPNSWGAGELRADPTWLRFFISSLPLPPFPTVLCSTVTWVLLCLSFKDPIHCPLCREPCSCLVSSGIPPGFREPVLLSYPPNTGICLCPLPWGPSPHMLLLFPERSHSMSPDSKLMQPVHLRGFGGVLLGAQGSLVCETVELRFLLGSWAVCFPGEGGFMFSFFFPSGL